MSFESPGKFYADAQFPYGLRRSGSFTVAQADLLENYGQAYQALHQGVRQPANEEEVAFLAVCRGERAPATPHECAWMRFCDVTSLKLSRSRISAFGVCDANDFVLKGSIIDSNELEQTELSREDTLSEDALDLTDGAFMASRGDDAVEQFSL